MLPEGEKRENEKEGGWTPTKKRCGEKCKCLKRAIEKRGMSREKGGHSKIRAKPTVK